MRKHVVLSNNVYTMINGVLTMGDLKSVTYTSANEFTYEFMIGATKEVVTLSADTKFYNFETDFKDGNALEENFAPSSLIEHMGNLYKGGWAMVDGEPQHITILVTTATYHDTHKHELTLADGYVESDLHDSREKCLAWGEYKVEDAEGNIKIKVGYAKRMQLTDEQTKAVEEFIAMSKRMSEEMGIGIVLDCEDGCIGFWNKSEFKSSYFAYEGDEGDIEVRTNDAVVDWHSIPNASTRYCDDRFFYEDK